MGRMISMRSELFVVLMSVLMVLLVPLVIVIIAVASVSIFTPKHVVLIEPTPSAVLMADYQWHVVTGDFKKDDKTFCFREGGWIKQSIRTCGPIDSLYGWRFEEKMVSHE